MREVDGRAEVDVEDAVGLLEGVVTELTGAGEARVGDEDVDARCAVREAMHLLRSREVGRHDLGAIAELRRQCRERFLPPPMQLHRRALPVKRADDRLADPAAGARDECGLPG